MESTLCFEQSCQGRHWQTRLNDLLKKQSTQDFEHSCQGKHWQTSLVDLLKKQSTLTDQSCWLVKLKEAEYTGLWTVLWGQALTDQYFEQSCVDRHWQTSLVDLLKKQSTLTDQTCWLFKEAEHTALWTVLWGLTDQSCWLVIMLNLKKQSTLVSEQSCECRHWQTSLVDLSKKQSTLTDQSCWLVKEAEYTDWPVLLTCQRSRVHWHTSLADLSKKQSTLTSDRPILLTR